MKESLILIEGKNVNNETLRSKSLSNAKQLVVGSVIGFGVIMHIAANDLEDLNAALLSFAKIEGVTGIVTLMIRS
ncbi:MAG TPA: hypothetical protein VLA71_09795 [Algoriphagus sp.]|jgi:hypothetical protein|nr:hypothetical protein [Algoriphagus sp.]